jgi:hypothetical protein
VRPLSTVDDGFDYPATSDAVRVTVTPYGEMGDGLEGSPVDGVSDELWDAVTHDNGSDGLSLDDLGNAIQEYQKNPSDAAVDDVSTGLLM